MLKNIGCVLKICISYEISFVQDFERLFSNSEKICNAHTGRFVDYIFSSKFNTTLQTFHNY